MPTAANDVVLCNTYCVACIISARRASLVGTHNLFDGPERVIGQETHSLLSDCATVHRTACDEIGQLW